MRAAQFNGAADHREKTDEHRHLNEHRQTAAHRADLVLLHELHLLLHKFLRVVLVFFLERLHLRRERLHPFHRARAGRRQRPEHQLDDDRDQHDGPAVTQRRHVVQPVHRQQQRLGKKCADAPETAEAAAKIHHLVHVVFQVFADARQRAVFLRPGEQNDLPLHR